LIDHSDFNRRRYLAIRLARGIIDMSAPVFVKIYHSLSLSNRLRGFGPYFFRKIHDRSRLALEKYQGTWVDTGEYCVEYLSRAIANGNHRRICCLKNSLITNLRPRQEVNVSRSERENQIRPSSRHVPKHGAARCPDESLDSREISGI